MFGEAVTSIVAAAACTVATPHACPDTGVLMRDGSIAAELRRMTLGRNASFLYGRDAPVAGQLLEVLGGPPEKPVAVGPYRLFAACRAKSCTEKGAVLVDDKGAVAGAAILYTGCGAGGAPVCDTADRRLALFIAGSIPSQAQAELLRWGTRMAGAGALSRISVERTASAEPSVTIDFDGDGKTDRVVIENTGGMSRLIAYRASAPDRGIVITHVRDPRTFHVGTLEGGTYPTACGKGVGAAPSCLATSVRLKRQAISYGTAEASLFAAEWNGRAFVITALAD